MSILGVSSLKAFQGTGILENTKFKFNTNNGSEGDGVNFSSAALTRLNTAGDTFSTKGVTTSTTDGKAVNVSFSTNSVSVGGTALKLGKFANANSDDIAVETKADGSGFTVYNLTNGKKLDYGTDGSAAQREEAVKNKNGQYTKDGKTQIVSGQDAAGKDIKVDVTATDADKVNIDDIQNGANNSSGINATLLINNKTAAVTGSANNDIIINRASNVSIIAGAGADKIFNLNSTVSSINLGDSGATGDSLYTVGLKNTTVTAGNDAYIKSTNTIDGAKINLGAGNSIIDATGKAMNNTTITSAAGTAANNASAIMAASMLKNTINLNAANSAIDVNGGAGAINDSKITMGTGANSIVASSFNKGELTNKGSGNFNLGTVNTLKYTGSELQDIVTMKGATSSSFDLGSGSNTIDATNKGNLNKTTIKSTGDTAINAGSINGDGATPNLLDLKGSDNSVSVAKTLQNVNVTLGSGANTLNVGGAISKAAISALESATGTTKISAASITGKGMGATTIDLLGGGGNEVSVSGTVTKAGNMNLGSGANTFSSKGFTDGSISSGVGSTNNQDISIAGNIKNLSYKGSDGDDTLKIGGAVNTATFDLGSGANSLVAQNAKNGKYNNLTDVSITASGAASTTDIKAGAFSKSAKADAKYGNISLGGGGNSVSFSGTVSGKGVNIDLGSGANTFGAAAMSGSKGSTAESITLRAGVGSSSKQDITIGGNVNYLNYMGSSGADTINVGGNVVGSNIDMGEGSNALTAKTSKGKATNFTDTTITGTGASTTNTIFGGNFTKSTKGAAGILLGGGGNNVSFEGTVSGKGIDINLGTGANSFTAKGVSGGKDSGEEIVLNIGGDKDQNITIGGNVNYMKYMGSSGADTLNIAGNIANSTLSMGEGSNSLTAVGKNGKGTKLTNTNISSTGTNTSTTITAGSFGTSGKNASAAMTLGGGGSNVSLSGTIGKGSTIDLGSGSNTLEAAGLAGSKGDGNGVTIKSGVAAGSTGSSNLTLTINGTTNYANINVNGGTAGLNEILLKGNVGSSAIDLGETADNIINVTKKNGTGTSNMTNVNLTATGASTTILNAANFGSSGKGGSSAITLGEGDNSVTLGKITKGSNLSFGSGANTLTAAGAAGAKTAQVNINFAASTMNQTVKLNGNSSYVNMDASSSAATVSVAGTITNANLNFGGKNSDSSLSVVNAKGKSSKLTNVNINATNAGGGTYGFSMTTAGLVNSNIALGDGKNSLIIEGSLAAGTEINLGKGSNSFTANGASGSSKKGVTINAADTTNEQTINLKGSVNYLTYNGGSGADTVNISGKTANTNLNLGEGNNSVSGAESFSNVNINSSGSGATSIELTKGFTGTGAGKSGMNLGDGANTVKIGGDVSNANLDLGAGYTTMSIGGKFGTNTKGSVTAISAGSGSFAMNSINNGSMTMTGSAGATIDMSGVISSGTIDLGSGGGTVNAKDVSTNSNISASGNATMSFTADKFAGSKLNLGGGSSSVTIKEVGGTKVNRSEIGGTGAGNMDINIGGASKYATFNLGTGTNSLKIAGAVGGKEDGNSTTINASADGGTNKINLDANATNLNFNGGGAKTVNELVAQDLDGGTINLGEGTTKFTAGATKGTKVTGTGGNYTVNLASMTASGKLASSVDINGTGSTNFTVTGNVDSSKISLESSTVTASFGGTFGADKLDTSLTLGSGANTVVMNAVTNATIESVAGAGSKTNLDIKGALTGGKVDLNSATNNFTTAGSVNGTTFSFGAGTTTLNALEGMTGADIKAASANTRFVLKSAKDMVETTLDLSTSTEGNDIIVTGAVTKSNLKLNANSNLNVFGELGNSSLDTKGTVNIASVNSSTVSLTGTNQNASLGEIKADNKITLGTNVATATNITGSNNTLSMGTGGSFTASGTLSGGLSATGGDGLKLGGITGSGKLSTSGIAKVETGDVANGGDVDIKAATAINFGKLSSNNVKLNVGPATISIDSLNTGAILNITNSGKVDTTIKSGGAWSGEVIQTGSNSSTLTATGTTTQAGGKWTIGGADNTANATV